MQATYSNTGLKKKKIIREITLLFFIAMILLTFFSKTINNYALSRVKVEQPMSGALIKEIWGDGYFEPRIEKKVYPNSGRLVSDILIEQGEHVEKGQLLFTLASEDLEEQLQEEQIRYEKLKLTLEQVSGRRVSSSVESAEYLLDQCRNTLDTAGKKLESAKNLFDAGAVSAIELDNAEYVFQAAEDTYKKAVKDHDVARKEYTANQQDHEAEIKKAEYDLKLQKIVMENLKGRIESSRVAAPASGMVTELNIAKGDMTGNIKPAVIIADISGGFSFRIAAGRDAASYVKIGEEVKIRVYSSTINEVAGRVGEFIGSAENENGMVEMVVHIENNSLTGGEKGSVDISKRTRVYNILIPVSAICSDNVGDYVWVVKEQKGPLSIETYVQKTYVKVEDSDNFKVAVINGITSEDSIVVEYSKYLQDNGKVVIENRSGVF